MIAIHHYQRRTVINGLVAPPDGTGLTAFFVWLARVDNRSVVHAKQSGTGTLTEIAVRCRRSRKRCMAIARLIRQESEVAA